MKINLGAGDEKIDGFVTVDYDANSNPDYVCNLEKDPLPFPDNTVETVVAHHVFEHLGEGFFHCLQEIYRVCKHGAFIDIKVPHPRHWHFLADPTHRRPILPQGLQLFSKKYNDVCKEQKVSASRLAYFYNVDFEILTVDEIPDEGYRKEFEGKPIAQVQKYLNEHNNIVAEIAIRMVVIKNYE